MGDEKIYALNNISFSIKEGEFVTIMGSSGSGKSTLLNILGCLDVASSGEYALDGIPIENIGKNTCAEVRNSKIGFVFQSYNLLPKTTALDNVELPLLYNSKISRKERKKMALEALESVGLSDRVHHKPNELSGGQQQRVSIARALVNQAVMLLADEATGNLDSKTSLDILKLFISLHKKGKTIIFVTHNPEIAEFSSRNIVLKDGVIVEDKINNDIKILS